jgi:hypothetical protein
MPDVWPAIIPALGAGLAPHVPRLRRIAACALGVVCARSGLASAFLIIQAGAGAIITLATGGPAVARPGPCSHWPAPRW